jgi:5-methylcytosine-specific restriction endonuclease McrA
VDTRRVYASKAWKRLKDQVLSEEIRCYLCGEFLYGQVDVDHKIPVESRPDLAFDRSNLGAAHHWCHSQKTQREK